MLLAVDPAGEADQQHLPGVQDEVHALSDEFLEENTTGSGEGGRMSMGRGDSALATRNQNQRRDLQMG